MSDVPLAAGTFAVTAAPDGGYRVSYRFDGQETEREFTLPYSLLSMVRVMSHGKTDIDAMIAEGIGG